MHKAIHSSIIGNSENITPKCLSAGKEMGNARVKKICGKSLSSDIHWSISKWYCLKKNFKKKK